MGCGVSAISDSEAAILEIGKLLHEAGKTAVTNPDTSFQKIREAERKLARVDDENQDHYAILVYSREGKLQYNLRRYQKAIEAYTKAVHIAEVKIAQKVRGLYLLLQRYAECMCDIARIWLKSAALAKSESKKLRETGKAELVLLRCVETIEEGHNRRSDLLEEPLLLLASIYEELRLFNRAELLARRVSGILIVNFGHEHPKIAETKRYLDALVAKKEVSIEHEAASRIQSVFKMLHEMRTLEAKLGRPVKRHRLIAREDRSPSPETDFLAQLAAETDGGLAAEANDSEMQLFNDGSGSPAALGPRASGAAGAVPAATSSGSLKKADHSKRSPHVGGLSSKTANPLDVATRPKPFTGVLEPVLSAEQVPPRLWTVEGDFDEDDLVD